MFNVSDSLKAELLKSSTSLSARILVGNDEYDTSKFIDFNIDSSLVPGEEFTIGTTVCQKLELRVLNTCIIPATTVIKPYISVLMNGGSEEIPLGVFNADTINTNKNIKTITAYDNMFLLGKAYFSDLSYPNTIQNIAIEICQKAGINFNSTLPNYTMDKIEGKTYREAIGIIAGLAGGFARINRLGDLEIINISTSVLDLTPTNYNTFTVADNPFVINKITAIKEDNTTLSAGDGLASTEVTFSNNYITQDILNSIFKNLSGYSYYPAVLVCQGFPQLDCGDVISITDTNNNKYVIPVMQNKLTYTGGIKSEINSIAKTATKSEYDYKGSVTTKVENIVTEQANIKLVLAEKIDTEQLNASNARITTLETNSATITQLNAANANIDTLTTNMASINKLLAGNIGASNLAAGAIQSGSAIIANGAIGAAQIGSVSASSITTGILDASVITVKNLNADNITTGSINGQRIASGAIDNSKVATGANIDGSKLNIDSVVTQINGATTNIQASKVAINGTTLDIQFSNINNTIDTQSQLISTQSTSITALQDSISLKVDSTDFQQYQITNTAVMNEAKNFTVNAINNIQSGGRNLLPDSDFENTTAGFVPYQDCNITITSSNETQAYHGNYCLKIVCVSTQNYGYGITYALPNPSNYTGKYITLSWKVKGTGTSIGKNVWSYIYEDKQGGTGSSALLLSDSWQTVSVTCLIPSEATTISIQLLGDYAQTLPNLTAGDIVYVDCVKLEYGNKASDWSPSPEDVQGQINTTNGNVTSLTTRMSTAESSITALNNSIILKVSTTDFTSYQTTVSNNFSNTNSNISKAQTTANTAITNAASAQNSANSAQSAANTAVTNAATAQTAANNAQTTANNKRRNFTSQPVPPYDLGDTWTQGTTGDMMTCTTAKASGSYTASDWTKSVKYTDDTTANTVQSNLNATNGNVTALTTRVSTAESSITTLNSSIVLKVDTTTYNSYKTTNDSNISNINSQLSTHSSSISVLQGQITSKVTQTDINNSINGMVIGSRNLLTHTDFNNVNYLNDWTTYNSNSAKATINCGFKSGEVQSFLLVNSITALAKGTQFGLISNQPFNLISGMQYTLSFLAATHPNADNNWAYTQILYPDSTTQMLTITAPTGSAYGVINDQFALNAYLYSVTFTPTKTVSGAKLILGDTVNHDLPSGNYGLTYVARIKLEMGSKATTWTSAPEDVQSQIDSATTRITNTETSITQLNNSIALKASQTDLNTTNSNLSTANSNIATLQSQMASAQLAITPSSIISTVRTSSAYQGDLTTANSKAQSYANIAQSNAQNYATTAVGNLKIGGRNLIKKSLIGGTQTTDVYGSNNAFYASVGAGANWRIQNWGVNGVYGAGVYSLSFWAKASVATNLEVDVCDQFSNNFSVTTSWQFFKIENMANITQYLGSPYYGFVDFAPGAAVTLYLSNIKLEQGAKCTDWTPAPEDVQTQIDSTNSNMGGITTRVTTAESTITQHSNQIALSVTAGALDGSKLAASINLQPASVKIAAKNIDITGAVTFNTLDPTMQGKINNALGQGLMVTNPNLNWTAGNSYPDGLNVWSGAPTRETTLVKSSASSVRMTCSAGGQIGFGFLQSFFIANPPVLSYYFIECTFMLVSGTLSGAGFIIDAPYATSRTAYCWNQFISNTQPLNQWITVKTVVPVTGTPSGNYAGYLMGNWSGIGDAAKDIIYDRFAVREPSQQEIDLYCNKGNWNDAKSKVDIWKYSGDNTKINGGNIQTGTITADKIKGNTLTLGGASNANGQMAINNSSGQTFIQGGLDSNNQPNFQILNASGAVKARIGQFSTGYGIEAYNDDGSTAWNTANMPPVNIAQLNAKGDKYYGSTSYNFGTNMSFYCISTSGNCGAGYITGSCLSSPPSVNTTYSIWRYSGSGMSYNKVGDITVTGTNGSGFYYCTPTNIVYTLNDVFVPQGQTYSGIPTASQFTIGDYDILMGSSVPFKYATISARCGSNGCITWACAVANKAMSISTWGGNTNGGSITGVADTLGHAGVIQADYTNAWSPKIFYISTAYVWRDTSGNSYLHIQLATKNCLYAYISCTLEWEAWN